MAHALTPYPYTCSFLDACSLSLSHEFVLSTAVASHAPTREHHEPCFTPIAHPNLQPLLIYTPCRHATHIGHVLQCVPHEVIVAQHEGLKGRQLSKGLREAVWTHQACGDRSSTGTAGVNSSKTVFTMTMMGAAGTDDAL